MTIAEAGLTVTVATGSRTLIACVVAVADSLVAVIVAVPTPTAVTVVVPLVELAGFTISTLSSLENQLTVRPVSTAPAASRNVATSCCVPPLTIGVVGAEIVTVVTGAITVMADVPLFVPLVAVTVAVPGPTAVTKPLASTVATASPLELHVIDRPVSSLPFASVVTAVSC